MNIKHFKDLEVYQISYQLALVINKLLANSKKYYELYSQIRRSSQSIPANIAEGFSRNQSSKDYLHFLRIALGSANETLVHLDFLKDLEIITENDHKRLYDNCEILAKKLNVLIQRIANNKSPITINQSAANG